MGNCFGCRPANGSNGRINSTRPPTSGTSSSFNNAGSLFTTTNSSRGLGQFPAASRDGDPGRIMPLSNLKMYTFSELRSATRNFKPDMMLGIGGFGAVYRGWVDSKTLAPSRQGTGMLVAVKKLNPESTQGFEEWQSEVIFLGQLSHPNLVRLLGYCWEDRELLLVYEFMSKGSLENHLFGRGAAIEPLSWDVRLKVALGAARGLAFLHAADKHVIYRDFKASNILLDGGYNAKISDFGLAKLGPSGGDSHVTTRVMGTVGYAAPEYVATGHLYVKSDVYGFGVVVLEMMTGLRAVDTRRPAGRHHLVDWMKPKLSCKKKVKAIVDARLQEQCSVVALQQLARLTFRCLEREHNKRPSMKEVVIALEAIAALE
ncbi:probable serine/threonine-protein kinase PIX13 isoform X2 [Andrographis paniculata]|uniref:probable serine/threonine-protein kinase PIX13 isoform X2 n=1 Tax=Andrographis paniculata TaxID=175694 RepID=UPI0021E774DB|nr:probable serine/threonine-protein kinase PIX13 isoform X2 [Andrographis paniculata]